MVWISQCCALKSIWGNHKRTGLVVMETCLGFLGVLLAIFLDEVERNVFRVAESRTYGSVGWSFEVPVCRRMPGDFFPHLTKSVGMLFQKMWGLLNMDCCILLPKEDNFLWEGHFVVRLWRTPTRIGDLHRKSSQDLRKEFYELPAVYWGMSKSPWLEARKFQGVISPKD